MNTIKLLYLSYTGNVRHFMGMLHRYSVQQGTIRKTLIIQPQQITSLTIPRRETEPFFVCMPTYNLVSTDPSPLKKYLQFENNASTCLGIVGNGDKSYLDMYCWTARRYAQIFRFPFLCDFELRGNHEDLERVYEALLLAYMRM